VWSLSTKTWAAATGAGAPVEEAAPA
jgi:hypothetical protein